MTHFERTYLMHRPSKLAISYADGSDKKSGVYDLTDAFNKHHQEIAMQLEYRELDRLAMELEKEISAFPSAVFLFVDIFAFSRHLITSRYDYNDDGKQE